MGRKTTGSEPACYEPLWVDLSSNICWLFTPITIELIDLQPFFSVSSYRNLRKSQLTHSLLPTTFRRSISTRIDGGTGSRNWTHTSTVKAFSDEVICYGRKKNIWEAWELFLEVEAENLTAEIKTYTLAEFANALCEALERGEVSPNTANSQTTIASRLIRILEVLETRRPVRRGSLSTDAWRCMAYVGLGNLEEARELMMAISQKPESVGDFDAIRTTTFFIKALASHESAENIVDLVVQMWSILYLHIYDIRRGSMHHATRDKGNQLRDLVLSIIDRVEDPMRGR
jgi:hypothetical protein